MKTVEQDKSGPVNRVQRGQSAGCRLLADYRGKDLRKR